MAQPKILVVDDEKGIRDLFIKVLGNEGYSVVTAKDGVEGVRKARAGNFGLILIDLRMPKMGGVNAIMEIKKVDPETAFIIVTGFPLGEAVEKVLKKGVYDCVRKPFNLAKLLKKIKKILKKKQISLII